MLHIELLEYLVVLHPFGGVVESTVHAGIGSTTLQFGGTESCRLGSVDFGRTRNFVFHGKR